MNDSDNSLFHCYQNCTYYYYFDDYGNYHCTEKKECPKNFSKLIHGDRRCVKNCTETKYTKYEFRKECYEVCPPDKSFNESINDYFCKITCPFEEPFEMVKEQVCRENCTIEQRYDKECRTNYIGNRSVEEVQNKVFIIDLKNILYNIKEITNNNNNDNYSNRNKSISFKKGNKIFNNININNYYNNNNFINLNKIKFNNYLGNINQAGLSSNIKFIKKNKSCEKRKCKNLNSNISANIRQNNSTEKRFKINDFKFIEAEKNNMKRNKKNNKTSLNSFSVGDSNLVIHEKNLQYTKLNIFFKIYSKFLRKRLMYNCIKIWKENIRINNLDKKIINKKIKLNEKLIKIIKSGNNTIIQNEKYNNDINCNNNSNNNNINNKILQNNVNVYYKKRIILNLDEPNYQGKNILTGLPVNNTINNNENEKKFIMTERNNSKLKLESDIYSHTEENMSLKNKIIEEKEIHFDKKIKRKLQYE